MKATEELFCWEKKEEQRDTYRAVVIEKMTLK